jgi:DNA excision repair protein ERCC-4
MKIKDNSKVDLKIDYREQHSGIVSELEKISSNLTFELAPLPTGDYWIGDKIIVERKTYRDFLSSIISGRIFKQAYRIAQSGKNSLIVLEGERSMSFSTSISRKAIKGAIIHLIVFIGIPVIYTLNLQETAEILISILQQCKRKTLPRKKYIQLRIPGLRFNREQRQKLFILQNLSGIGTKRALALLNSFGSIERIMSASPDDLKKVQGVGKKLADNIFIILHEPFLNVKDSIDPFIF